MGGDRSLVGDNTSSLLSPQVAPGSASITQASRDDLAVW
jgi:hypothetical protein